MIAGFSCYLPSCTLSFQISLLKSIVHNIYTLDKFSCNNPSAFQIWGTYQSCGIGEAAKGYFTIIISIPKGKRSLA
jgi:hypothetical protein